MIDKVLVGQFWANSNNIRGKEVVFEIKKVAMVFIEVIHQRSFTSPHEDIVQRVSEMRC